MTKLAIIGSYGHVGVVLDAAARREDVELAAVARWGEDDPLAFVGHHPAAGAAEVYDDYRRMLDEVRPDAAGVFMPLYRSAEASLEAVRRGVHVLSEKPLATTWEDLSALRDAVGAAGVELWALLAMRGEAVYQAVRQVVAEGRIGEPLLAFGQKSYPFADRDGFYKDRRTYGGSIPWSAIHAIDFVGYCAGKDYVRVAAMHSNAAHPSHPGMEDGGGVLLEFAGGGHALISFDYLRPYVPGTGRAWGDERLRIAGTRGVVEIVDAGRRVELTTPDRVEDVPLPPARDLAGEFIAALAAPGEGLITTAESLRATEVALTARDAADTGRVLPLAPRRR